MKTVKYPIIPAGRSAEDVLIEWADFCEADFSKRLTELCRRIVADGRTLITLTGPSCAGKTTTAHKLIEDFSKAGKRVLVVSLDDFYRDRDILIREAEEEGRAIDFDSPSTLNWKLLRSFVEDVLAHRPAHLPHFDFVVGKSVETRVIFPDSFDILLFEGIQGLYREFLELLPKGSYAAVFIHPDSGFKVGEHHLNPREIRLIRRMVRDRLFRGASPEFTLQLWENVTANEDRYIYPMAPMAHYRLDSFMGYELCLFKEACEEAIASLPESAVTAQIMHIQSVLREIAPFSAEHLQENSLLHEFVG